jgi:hypothetical protein
MAKEFRYNGYQFTEEDIRTAMANTRSNAEAARYLKVSVTTYQKYAKMHIDQLTGKSLWHLHMNIPSKGIPKKWNTGELKGDLDKMLTENQLNNPKRLGVLKSLLMKDGRLGYCCSACNYSERRLTDMKMPLMLSFKNGIRNDWRLDNLRWICYNCSFILGLDYFSNRMVRDMESFSSSDDQHKQEIKSFYELDDFYMEHLSKLGLDDKGDVLNKNKNVETTSSLDEGEEFIDRI